MTLVLDSNALHVAVCDGALATKFRYNNKTFAASGCVYDQSGALVDLSRRASGFGGDRIVDINPERHEPTGKEAHVSGQKYLYLGNLMAHYGHFILETLSTFWSLSLFPDYTPVFHPFVFGKRPAAFMEFMCSSLGVDITKAIVIDEDTIFDRLVIPQRTLHLNHSVHTSFASAHRRISEYAKARTTPYPVHDKVFLSRSRLDEGQRSLQNALDIDQEMAVLGFEIVHPQEMTVEAQILMYATTRVMSGCAGSAMHNALFAPVGARIIEIGDLRSPRVSLPAQRLCTLAAGLDSHFIPFRASSDNPGSMDVEYLRESVRPLLGI